jgi:hypothetical protein
VEREPEPPFDLFGGEVFPQPPVRRRPLWTWLALGALVVFEIVMLVYFLLTSPKSRPDSFLGIWIFGSGVLATLLAIAQGMTPSDFIRATRGL